MKQKEPPKPAQMPFCSICGGRGLVPAYFYDKEGTFSVEKGREDVPCRRCVAGTIFKKYYKSK